MDASHSYITNKTLLPWSTMDDDDDEICYSVGVLDQGETNWMGVGERATNGVQTHIRIPCCGLVFFRSCYFAIRNNATLIAYVYEGVVDGWCSSGHGNRFSTTNIKAYVPVCIHDRIYVRPKPCQYSKAAFANPKANNNNLLLPRQNNEWIHWINATQSPLPQLQ